MPPLFLPLVAITATLMGVIPATASAATYNVPRKAYYLDHLDPAASRGVYVSARNDQAGTTGTTCVRVINWRTDHWEEQKGCGTATVAIDDLLGSARIQGTIPSRRYIGTTGDITQQPTADQGELSIDIEATGTGLPAQNVVGFCGLSPCTGSSVLSRQALSTGSVSAPLVGVNGFGFSGVPSRLELLTFR